ncbi:MAG: hypothetical protein IJ523_12575 [Succinivibrionaceae bacterium]|nr:hypothetical protein [Succinivibrionaceae bacterium]
MIFLDLDMRDGKPQQQAEKLVARNIHCFEGGIFADRSFSETFICAIVFRDNSCAVQIKKLNVSN